MKYITKLKLAAIHQLCDVEDKSTEFMIQFMIDTVKVDHDTVMAYLALPPEEINKIRSDVNEFLEFFEQFADMEPT